MNEEYIGVTLTVIGLLLVLIGIATVLSVSESAFMLVSLAATVGLGALATGCVLLYRVGGRRRRK